MNIISPFKSPLLVMTVFALTASINAWANSQSLEARFPSLLNDGSLNPDALVALESANLTLSNDTKVMAYFISEDTEYQNTIGWYDVTNDPADPGNRETIWENASEHGSGGLLKIGRPVNLGKFLAGDGMGFFISADGYNLADKPGAASRGSEDETALTYFSDPGLNPDGVSHILLSAVPEHGLVVAQFNDQSGGGGFNDVIMVLDIGVENARNMSAGAPEPGEWALMLVGGASLLGMARRRVLRRKARAHRPKARV